ncbi:hypothetical protein [Nodosilinea nodulosa]|uniref:hypothetical protein n=1 Tax=Nodosilinea nodulosa TaxID=416001 RepID=UPI0002E75C02|nr:hypothetical protein [Nodosilinea nodulosa]
MPFSTPNFTLPTVPLTPDLLSPLASGPPQPIAMFPVRLETRFSPLPGGGADLRVRVYPDKVHLDSHEPALTAAELTWGQHFWAQTWRAGNDQNAQQLAWQQLSDRFDPRRAAWVAQALTPLNPQDRPAVPVANEQPLPQPIRFPAPPTKVNDWTRAPLARALPDRWHLCGYARGQLIVQATGNPIAATLAVGPDPSAFEETAPSLPSAALGIDAGMKWMVDFEEAEKVGMGLRVRLDPKQAQGFDILLVFGTQTGPDPGMADGTAPLVDLLNAHRYSDGLSFVPLGTPSNNTPEAPAGYSSAGQAEGGLADRDPATEPPGDRANAEVLATALGLGQSEATPFTHLAYANLGEQSDARHMNRALWPATGGYFLTQMLGPSALNRTGLTADDIAWVQQHFVEYVRAGGPLPALRVGKQPYGILPVTSLNGWKPRASQPGDRAIGPEVALKDLLIKLRGLWHKILDQVPRVGRSQNPDQDFADIFTMEAISSSYHLRHLVGRTYLERLWASLQPGNVQAWWDKQQGMTRPILQDLGLNGHSPRLAETTFSGWHRPLDAPMVQPEAVSEAAALSPNYIDLLLNAADLDTLRGETFPEPKPKSLLYALLRHSLLQLCWTTAVALLVPDGQSPNHWGLRWEQELIGPPSFTGLPIATATPWDLLNQPLTGVTTDSLGRYLLTLSAPPTDPSLAAKVAPLLELRQSLTHLKGLSTATLERQLAGSLDLCSHRLDAWITSFATRRLSELRQASPTGLLLGGYGWVTNLKPKSSAVLETPPPGESAPLHEAIANPGFTHTPSLDQAATVAVLRSGHLTHASAADADLLAIDLSSERVRLANWLLDGVRQGQPLGALLGYRFERRLQGAGLGEFIPYFREIAPLVAKKLEQSAQPVAAIAANTVVDGLALQRRWQKNRYLPALFTSLAKPPDSAQFQRGQTALPLELDRLADAVDAVSDALLAESVHQAVQGNPLRTASTLEAIARGETPPPELDVLQTPRTGTALTYRLVTLFSGPPTGAPGWMNPAVSPRAGADLQLNTWAAKLLGNAGRVRCRVERFDPATGEALETQEVRLGSLPITAIDCLYADEGSHDAQPSELEQRILYEIRRRPEGFSADAALRINPQRPADWGPADLSYGEFNELRRRARQLITGARGVDASDLAVPGQNPAIAVDMTELESRAQKGEQALFRLQSDLKGLLKTPAIASLEALRAAILRAGYFSIAGAIPLSAVGETPTDRDLLLGQAQAIVNALAQRLTQLAALQTSSPAAIASPTEQRDHQISRLRITFGPAFVALPRFTPDNAAELAQALADSPAIQANDPLAVVTWFQRAARVRDGLARLNIALLYAEAVGTGETLNLAIAQLPYQPRDRWVGLPKLPAQPLSTSRFSLIVQGASPLDLTQPLTGLLIDEWVEVVPNETETTGLVFQYDQPDATPPQSILLAVPPDLTQPWTVGSLQQVLLETLDLARLRAVDPEALGDLGHYLPALYFAANDKGGVVSAPESTIATDFSSLK